MMGRVIAFILALMLPIAAQAQTAASLVADRVSLSGRVLTASGNVTVFAGDVRLSAAQIRYDGVTDRLSLTGPITLTAADGTVMTATQADLDADLRAGLLRGARLVLDRRLQLAAARADKDGALTQLTGVAVTACQTCPGRAPLWSIRADRVIHDAQAQRLWFDNARLLLRGRSVLGLPRLSLPDPTATRARGWLRPRFSAGNALGTTLRLPYFLPVDARRDVTLTPVLAARATGAELRYRHALPGGGADITLMAARMRDGRVRAYATGTADARLPGDWQLNARLEQLSDDDVAGDFGLPARDRDQTALSLTRVRAHSLTRARIALYSPRAGEDPATAPLRTLSLRHTGRLTPGAHRLIWDLSAEADAPLTRGTAAGRIGLGAGYDRMWIIGPGAELRARADLRADWHSGTGAYRTGAAQIALGWPLMRRGAGATHVIEPLVALTWGGESGTRPVLRDARRIGVDEGTPFVRHPAPGDDLFVPGLTGSAGLSWQMQSAGITTRLSAARIWRADPAPRLAASTGLDGTDGGWILRAQARTQGGLSFDTLSVLGGSGALRSESRLGWAGDALRLDATHLFLRADPAETRPRDISLAGADAVWQASPEWQFSAAGRYDIAAGQPVSASVGAMWHNECVRVGISASHRFATLSNVAATDFGLDLSIDGFSASSGGLRAGRSCRAP